MSIYTIDGSLLTNIAAAIRSKKGVSTTYTPAQMATAISGLSVGLTSVAAINRTYSSNEKRVPQQGSVDITLSNAIDSIKNVNFSTYSNAPIGGVALIDSRTIRIYGASTSDAYLNTLIVYGYTHKVQ